MKNLLPPDDHEWLIRHDTEYREYWKLEAYSNFWYFCLFMDYGFFYARRKVLEEVCRTMQNLILPDNPEDEIDIMNSSLPPRTGKSYACTLFCGWALGRFPKESIMRNTVTAQLSEKFHNDLIKLFDGDANGGRYAEVFRQDITKKSVKGITLRSAKQGVSYFGAGCGGAIIGFGASLLSIIDDSVKNEEEALSELQMDKKWGWYTSTVDSREENGCKKLFIGTRWSNRDIVGRLKEHNIFSGDRTRDITIPALDADELSYCEDIHTTESLLQKRLITDELIWEAEWQQQPIEAKGLLFPSDSLNYFSIHDLRLKEADGVIVVGDIADEGDDSLCVPVGYQYGEKIFIVDVVFTKEPIEITEPIVAQLIDDHAPDKILFESNNGGKGFARAVEKLITHRAKVKWKPTVSNKHTRIIMKSGIIKKYFYFRNDPDISREYRDFLSEITRYNRAGKNKHDDAPDGITMLAEVTTKRKWGFASAD